MTPEQMQQLHAHLQEMRNQQQRQEVARAEEAKRLQRQQMVAMAGGLLGTAVSLGLMRLLNRDKAKAQTEDVLTEAGDQCKQIVREKVAGLLGADIPVFRPDDPPEGDIKEADYEIVD